MNTRIAIDNKVVDKEPAGRLIDKRFAKVNDWEKEENNSIIKSTNNINDNSDFHSIAATHNYISIIIVLTRLYINREPIREYGI